MNKSNGKLPLEGIRVADFTWVAAGPFCTRWLGALGAEVIKVTSQRRPDPTSRGTGWYSSSLNKRCCTINIAEPEGQALARRLVSISDVLVETYGYGAMERLGLGYEEVRKSQPDIIYFSSSGLGKTGPDKTAAAYGSLISSYTGWASITGHEGAEPLVLHQWTDPLAGLTMAYTILACLYNRQVTGMGQYVDFSMAEGTTSLIPEPVMDYGMNGRVQSAKGNKDEFMAPHSAYKCSGQDEWVAIAVASDSQWQALCRVMGRPDLAGNSSYATQMGRWHGQETLDKEVGIWTRLHGSKEVVELLQAVGVPAGASVQPAQLGQDPYLQATGYIQAVQQDGILHPVTGLPWPANEGPAWRFSAAPAMGEANDYVAGELLGLSESEIESLVERKVLW